ncbi:MAG: hypothetical protein ACD_84C00045G0001, partial [uncultured bacterium]
EAAAQKHKQSSDKVLQVMAAEKYARRSRNYLPLLKAIGFYKGYEDPDSRLPCEIEAEALGLFDIPKEAMREIALTLPKVKYPVDEKFVVFVNRIRPRLTSGELQTVAAFAEFLKSEDVSSIPGNN